MRPASMRSQQITALAHVQPVKSMGTVYAASTYWFGDFKLNRPARELRRASALLTVSPKVFDCLLYLLDHRDRAIGHDELIAAVWGNVNVAEVQLRHLVRKVRYVIDPTGSDESFIRTIPRFGYRWIGPLRDESATEEKSARSAEGSASAQSHRGSRRSLWAISAVMAIVLVGMTISVLQRRERPAAPIDGTANATLDRANAVAILPVESDDFTDDDAWMRLGLMDLVAVHLRTAGAVVVPSADIVPLEQANSNAGTLSRRVREVLGVSKIVESRMIRRDGSGWTLQITLDGSGASAATFETHATDAIVAVREASNKLLTLLGKHPPIEGASQSSPQVAALRQRVEAAWLVGNIERAQRLWKDAPEATRAIPEMQLLGAKIDLASGNANVVEVRLEKMLDALSPEADPVLRAGILNELGAAERQTENWDLARQRLDESIRLLGDLNQPLLLGSAYAGRAAIGSLQGRYDDAQGDFSQARIAFALAGDSLQVARTEANEGVLEAMQAHPAQALNLLTHAAQNLERFGDRSWLVNALANKISAQLDLLHPAEAFDTSQRMSRELPQMGSSIHARIARLQQVPALIESGHLDEVHTLIRELQQIESAQRDQGSIGALLAYESELALDEGRWQEARDDAAQALVALSNPEDDDVRGLAWLVETRALRALQRNDDAAIEVQKFSAWAHEHETPRRSVRAELAQAEQAWAEQSLQPAHELYEIALHIAHDRGVPADVAEVAISYGNALLDAGELSRAATVVGQVAPWASYDYNCALIQARLYRSLGRDELWRTALAEARSLSVERPMPLDVTEPPPHVALQGAATP